MFTGILPYDTPAPGNLAKLISASWCRRRAEEPVHPEEHQRHRHARHAPEVTPATSGDRTLADILQRATRATGRGRGDQGLAARATTRMGLDALRARDTRRPILLAVPPPCMRALTAARSATKLSRTNGSHADWTAVAVSDVLDSPGGCHDLPRFSVSARRRPPRSPSGRS